MKKLIILLLAAGALQETVHRQEQEQKQLQERLLGIYAGANVASIKPHVLYGIDTEFIDTPTFGISYENHTDSRYRLDISLGYITNGMRHYLTNEFDAPPDEQLTHEVFMSYIRAQININFKQIISELSVFLT